MATKTSEAGIRKELNTNAFVIEHDEFILLLILVMIILLTCYSERKDIKNDGT